MQGRWRQIVLSGDRRRRAAARVKVRIYRCACPGSKDDVGYRGAECRGKSDGGVDGDGFGNDVLRGIILLHGR